MAIPDSPHPKVTINVTVVEAGEPGEPGTFHVVGDTVFYREGAPNTLVELAVALMNGTTKDIVFKVVPLIPVTNPPQPPDLMVASQLEGHPLKAGATASFLLDVLINPALSPGSARSLDVEFVVTLGS